MNQSDEYLYHYTSLRGLIGIIENENLWATHTRFLNDYQEVKEGFEYFRENKNKILTLILDKVNSGKNNQQVKENIEKRFEEFNKFNKVAIEDEPTFITSFTTERDNLTHWLSYGSNETSYCLKIRKEKLESPSVLLKNTQQYLCPIDYIDTESEKDNLNRLSSDMYRSFLNLYKIEKQTPENIDESLGRGLFDIYLDFLFHCSSIKNKKYLDEKENRLIVISPANFSVNGNQPQDYYSTNCNMDNLDNENYAEYKIKYRANNGVLIPYIEVPFDIHSIAEIIIGPSNSKQEAKIGLEYFCKANKLESEITFTTCPYRIL
jgi:hypothetical protein